MSSRCIFLAVVERASRRHIRKELAQSPTHEGAKRSRGSVILKKKKLGEETLHTMRQLSRRPVDDRGRRMALS